MDKQFYVYIVTNTYNSVLYTGITNDVKRRMFEHKHKLLKGFTKKYKVDKLVFCEEFNDSLDAIRAEKTIKGWTKQKKLNLIKNRNPEFEDLSEKI
jgi:putative endonuclease